ncbi:MAG: glycosyltransferase family 39 protein [Ktedonobacterales bacterium]
MAATDSTPALIPVVPPRRLAAPGWMRTATVYAALFFALLLLQQVSFAATRVPTSLTITPTRLTLLADGQTLSLALPAAPSQVVLVSSSPLDREFQIDGTDSINNFTTNPDYIISLADSPYFRFQSWMRDAGSYSSWRDLTARDAGSGRVLAQADVVAASTSVTLPPGRTVVVSAALQRPEAPVQILLLCGQNPCAQLVFDRNDRYISAESLLSDGSIVDQRQLYFPLQPLPFLAEDSYLLAHVALWSLALLGILALLHTSLLLALDRASRHVPVYPPAGFVGAPGRRPHPKSGRRPRLAPSVLSRVQALLSHLPRALRARNRWDVLAALLIAASFIFTCYIAVVQYSAEPHILDASAYYFQAKIFASGHLAAPAPADSAAFAGPFMVAEGGRWFAQYPPATSALLALGLLAHLPWIVEPLLGALSLWGIYRIGCRLFSRPVACLAVLLGGLSAFYTFLAATYLSHAVALFFGVYFILFLLRFAETHAIRDLCLGTASWGGLLLTRELSAAILGACATLFIFIVYRRTILRDRLQCATAAIAALGVALLGLSAYLLYNRLQTGDPFMLPRTLFSPADRYGFGAGIGFYGQHTLAAGFVILDQLLTILQIDLFGWPFYLTLAFIPLAFLDRSVRHTWYWFCLVLLAALTLAQAGYFYHGIYLGPRYLYDALPFLLLLTARGIANLTRWLAGMRRYLPAITSALRARTIARVLVGLTVAALLACNLVYYLPRQFALTSNFTGLPAAEPVDVTALYAFHPASSLLVTDDWYIYSYILFPLNNPTLNGPTLYAYAPTDADVARLQSEYPTRTLYVVSVAPNGHVTFTPAHR